MAISTADRGRTRRGLRAVTLGAAALTGVSLLSGCGGKAKDESLGDDPVASTPASAASSASASADPQEAVKGEVTTAYRKYWDAQIQAYAKASPVGTDLEKYAFDKALSKALGELATLYNNGNVIKGEVKVDPKVSALSLDEKPKKATIADCTDVSRWVLQNKKSGQAVPLPKERLTRFQTTVSLRTVGDAWKVVDVQQLDKPCG
ncbi:hypothetical protein [Streptomyces sp. XH2]|uniref:hypothetical protein n=1 Tax=Streptomyces sp. XH2 TaxID=3412483 RepID=UPI003C7EC58A